LTSGGVKHPSESAESFPETGEALGLGTREVGAQFDADNKPSMLARDSPDSARSGAQTCQREATGSECNYGLGVVDVKTERDLGTLVEFLLGERCMPVVALAPIKDDDMVVLAPQCVRAVIGPGAPLYIMQHEHLLDRLTSALGRELTLTVGAARVWWPGLTRVSDPLDHPLVTQMESEQAGSLLEKFALRFRSQSPASSQRAQDSKRFACFG
jgi:hypothetical protein